MHSEAARLTRRRAIFAGLRIVQATAVVVAFLLLALVAFSGAAPRMFGPHDQRHLETVAPMIASTSQEALALGAGALAALAVVLQLIGIPLKARWSRELRGWIR
jgi:hypothetical protein